MTSSIGVMNSTTMDITTNRVTTKDDHYRTTDGVTSEHFTFNHTNYTHVPAGGPHHDGGGRELGPISPSKWLSTAVIGGIILLALIGMIIVLVYRKKRQSDYHRRAKSTDERVGFIDAEAENRRSDIAQQLLQVTDPSYFELEEAAQNAKLQELQGQDDLNILEIIQGPDDKGKERKGQAQHDKKVKDKGNEDHKSNTKTDTKDSDKKDEGLTNVSKRASKGSVSGVSALDNVNKPVLDAAVPANKKGDEKCERKSNTGITTCKEVNTTLTKSSNTSIGNNVPAKRSSEKVRSSGLPPSVRNSRESDHGDTTTHQDSNSGNSALKNGTSEFDKAKEWIKERRSLRSSGSNSTDNKVNEKLNHNSAVLLPVNGVTSAADVARPKSTISSKHSSVSYEETISQLKHIDSDPNIAGQ